VTVHSSDREREHETALRGLRDRSNKMEIELLRRSRELEQANEELRSAGTATTAFLAHLCHELRSPLTAILGFAELLTYAELDEQQHHRASVIFTEAKRLGGLVTQALAFSKAESGGISISPELVPLRSVIEEALESMRPLAEENTVAIDSPAFSAECEYAVADSRHLKDVLVNLISNAITYNRRGGTVSVTVAASDHDRIRIAVADTGPGIDEAGIAKLFVPFERLDASSGGTGLGLALSRTLVEAMGGTIGVESTPGAGSVFWVELRSSTAAPDQVSADADAILAIRDYSGGRSLLYIEDTPANVTLVQDVLERRPNVELIPVARGELGFELALRHRPHMILLDMHLPDISGDEVLARLQQDETTRDIPVVFLSADETVEREPLLAAGAKAFLSKPIAIRELLEALDLFLEEPAG
jgi:nitrogen-specific signal transduction histidine kinase